MLEVVLDGLFTERQAKSIKEKLSGKTYFNFEIEYSNYAGNYSIIVRSNNTSGHTQEELLGMFYYCCLCELAK